MDTITTAPNATDLPPIAVGIDEGARLVGISRASLYEAIRRGDGPTTAKVCGRRVVRIDELHRWVRALEQQRAQPSAA